MSDPSFNSNCIVGVMVDHGIELWSSQTKDYKIGISCFSAKYVPLRNKPGLLRIMIMKYVCKQYIPLPKVRKFITNISELCLWKFPFY